MKRRENEGKKKGIKWEIERIRKIGKHEKKRREEGNKEVTDDIKTKDWKLKSKREK